MQASFAQRREKAVRDIDWPAAPSKAAKDAWTAVQNPVRRPGPRASACSAVLRKHMYLLDTTVSSGCQEPFVALHVYVCRFFKLLKS